MKYEDSLSHMFTFDGEHFLLDIHSGAIHVLSSEAKQVADFWRSTGCELEELPALWLQAHPAHASIAANVAALQQESADHTNYRYGAEGMPDSADIREICDALAELIEEGLLMSETPELAGYVLPEDYVVKALCLHVAHDCNLRCRYCFAGTGAFGGDRSLMSYDTGKEALDFLFEASGARTHVEVDYFGGEPLMNFEVVKALILYGEEESRRRGKVLKQTLTTNGLLLHGQVLDFLNDHDIALVMSLDGREEVHDRMRPAIDGRGSYRTVLPRLKAAVESRDGDQYYLRGTFTRYNMDFFQDVRHMVDAGFSLVSVEPVVAGPEEEYAFVREDLPVLFAQYEELARYFLEKRQAGEPFTFFHFHLEPDQGPCLPKRLTGCGAGHEYLAVSPEGKLYPCHQFVGNPDFVMGTVDTGINRPELSLAFRQNHVLAKKTCTACWARFYCGGGCHANAWNFHSALSEPYEIGCELEKKRLECAIWIYANSPHGL